MLSVGLLIGMAVGVSASSVIGPYDHLTVGEIRSSLESLEPHDKSNVAYDFKAIMRMARERLEAISAEGDRDPSNYLMFEARHIIEGMSERAESGSERDLSHLRSLARLLEQYR